MIHGCLYLNSVGVWSIGIWVGIVASCSIWIVASMVVETSTVVSVVESTIVCWSNCSWGNCSWGNGWDWEGLNWLGSKSGMLTSLCGSKSSSKVGLGSSNSLIISQV